MRRFVRNYLFRRPVWVIPMIYVGATSVAAITLPRLEHAYLASYSHSISVASAQAMPSSIASGMMALTGIIFSLAFVMVQFGATPTRQDWSFGLGATRCSFIPWGYSLPPLPTHLAPWPGLTARAPARCRSARQCS